MRVGLVYDLHSDFEWQPDDPEDADAELEPEETVLALEAALVHLGHEVVRIGPVRNLLAQLSTLKLEAALSIAEQGRSRNREAYAPILFELAGIPFLGSDALTLTLSVDKVWTKELVATVGVVSPRHWVASEEIPLSAQDWASLTAYLAQGGACFLKPRYEGTAKGITPASKVRSLTALREQITYLQARYKQDVLIEEFIEGSEFTVAVVGDAPLEALPALQRATEKETGIGLHALERKGVMQKAWEYELTSALTPALEVELQAQALAVHRKLGCKDFTRSDFRVTPDGRVYFLEVNTLPTFAPDGTFAVLAELEGLSYPIFLAKILERGLRRIVPHRFA